MADIFELFRQISGKSEGSAPVSWLVVGLGNPGDEYRSTRHNAGFMAIDEIARDLGAPVDRMKFHALTGDVMIDGVRVLLMKPMTMMNASGIAVGEAAGFYKLPPERVLVFSDDITLAPGRLRVRAHGSAGGHNGLKSIIASFGTENFNRIRIGIGAKPNPQYDLAAWVLGKLPAADRKAMTDRYPDIEDACKLLMDGNLQYAQNKFNH